MKKLVMVIGLPFSGKSTLAEKFAGDGYVLIKRDDLLEQIINSTEFERQLIRIIKLNNIEPENREAVFFIKNKIAVYFLSIEIRHLVLDSTEDKFFYDGTNIQKETRAPIIKLKEDNVSVEGIYLKVPIEEIRRRANYAHENLSREGNFNDLTFNGLEPIIAQLEEPSLDEGFSDLKVQEFEPELKREFSFR